MKSPSERMSEFVDYHINGDGECNNVVLNEWAKNLDFQDKYDLAFLFSITYCVESAVILFEKQKKEGCLTDIQAKEIKPKLVFQSDRKYMRMKDNFERCLKDYQDNHKSVYNFVPSVSAVVEIDLEKAIRIVSKWVMFGRFSAFLFLETFAELTGIAVRNTTIKWKEGDTATSGLMNLFGYDLNANLFDKTGKLTIPDMQMDKMLFYTANKVKQAGGNDSVTEIETSLCAYRKFYKGTRYNGFYLDRMLEELNYYKAEYPGITQELFEIRRRMFKPQYLGELNGWDGIRSEMKKLYKETGIIP